jgi:hypothetical protein
MGSIFSNIPQAECVIPFVVFATNQKYSPTVIFLKCSIVLAKRILGFNSLFAGSSLNVVLKSSRFTWVKIFFLVPFFES